MDQEIQEIFNQALEQEEMPEVPEALPAEETAETAEVLAPVEERERGAEEAARDGAILEGTMQAAIAASGARDPELLRLLLEQAGLTVEDGKVTGLSRAMEDIRQNRPYLFRDQGGRPRFSAATMDRGLYREEEAVALRYRNNPWYRRK